MNKALNVTLKKKIFDVLDSKEKQLSDSTKNLYYQRLKWVREELKIKSDDPKEIVSEVDKVWDLLDKSKIAITSKALTAVQLSQLANLMDLSDNIKEKYTKASNVYSAMSDMSRRTNKLEGKKAERFVPWAEIESVYDKMPESTFTEVSDKLIVGLYTRMPGVLRLDYANVQVYNSKSDRHDNWFHRGKGKYTFYLNKYKTTSKYGAKVIEVEDPDLIRLLKKWFDEYNSSMWLLVSYRDHEEPLNETSLSRRIMNIFKRYLGKEINNGMLRISKESSIINDPAYKDLSLNDQIALHEKQLHGFLMSHEYNKK